MNFANETNQKKKGFIDIKIEITMDNNIRITAKFDNDNIDFKSILHKKYVLTQDDYLNLHVLKSITNELQYNNKLSFNTLNMVIADK